MLSLSITDNVPTTQQSNMIPTHPPGQNPINLNRDQDNGDHWERKWEWIKANGRLAYPEPEGEFQPRQPPPSLDLKTNYGKRGLQVIVKL